MIPGPTVGLRLEKPLSWHPGTPNAFRALRNELHRKLNMRPISISSEWDARNQRPIYWIHAEGVRAKLKTDEAGLRNLNNSIQRFLKEPSTDGIT